MLNVTMVTIQGSSNFNSVELYVLVAYILVWAIFGTDWSIYFKFGHNPRNALTVSLQENLSVFNQC